MRVANEGARHFLRCFGGTKRHEDSLMFFQKMIHSTKMLRKQANIALVLNQMKEIYDTRTLASKTLNHYNYTVWMNILKHAGFARLR